MGADGIKECYLELTRKCPLRCEHCYAFGGENAEMDLSTADWFEIIRKLSGKGIRDAVLLGGEPLLRPDIYKILQFAIDNFENVVLETSGVVPSELDGYDCTVSVSLESHIPSKNDSIRHGPVSEDNPEGFIYSEHFKEWRGHFELALSKLKGLTNPKIIRYTLRQDTDIISSILLAEKVGAKAVFVPLIAMGRGSSLDHLVPNAKKLRESYELLSLMNYRTRGKHIIQHPQYFLWDKRLLSKVKDKLVLEKRICAAGRHRLFIDSFANTYPCPFITDEHFYCGNILRDDVNYIYKNLDIFNEWVASVPARGKCATCVAYKICNGGGVCTWINDLKKQGINCPMNLSQEVVKK